MPQVLSPIVAAVIGFGMARGVTRRDLLSAARVREADLEDPDGLVPYQALVEIWRLLVARFPGEPLGLEYAGWQRLEVYGLVGQLCLAAADGEAAIGYIQRFLSLVDPYMELVLGPTTAGYRMEMRHEPQVYALEEPLEMLIGTNVRLTREALGVTEDEPGVVREVAFRHPRRHAETVYREFFRCPVRFEASYDGATFDAAVLARPMAGANPQVARYLGELATQRMNDRGATATDDPWRDRLHEALGAALTAGTASAPAVAHRMGMSARTLQRRLAERGTTYREELDAHRREAAYRLLEEPQRQAGEVAFLLGYADPGHFFRAFRRWTGTTPQRWRRASTSPAPAPNRTPG